MKNRFPSVMSFIAMLMVVFAIAGCASTSKQDQSLEETLKQYEQFIRWSQWDGAVDFLAREYLDIDPVTRLDMDRLRLFRVTQYAVRSATPLNNGLGFTQVVEIRLFNRNRAVEKTLIDTQEWRFDETRENWFLHTGLPDVTKSR